MSMHTRRGGGREGKKMLSNLRHPHLVFVSPDKFSPSPSTNTRLLRPIRQLLKAILSGGVIFAMRRGEIRRRCCYAAWVVDC